MGSQSTVFLSRVSEGQTAQDWALAVSRLVDASKGLDFVRRNDLVALKVHVGEPPLKTALPPEVGRSIALAVRASGGRPFYTDSAVLYASPRSHGVGHAEVADRRGFNLERAGAVFVPADGIEGNAEVQIEIAGNHYKRVGIAAAIANANGAVILSHATGHLVAGYGATLKNLGMGCAPRKGKLLQHSDTKPFVSSARCIACGQCLEHCPSGALQADTDGKALMREDVCTGCAECITHCRTDAIGFRWDCGSERMQQKMVEHAMAVVQVLKQRIVYVLGIVNLTQHCDCMGSGAPIVAPDIGFALSSDPVALDQAGLDLVASRAGKPLDQLAWPDLDGTIQLAYAEQLGLGHRQYELAEV